MLLSRLRRVALTAVPTALALVAVSAAHAASTTVEGFGPASAVGLAATASTDSVTPTQIPEAAAAIAAAVSRTTSFVLTPDGVLAAGEGNLGLGSVTSVPAFTPVPGTADAQAVAASVGATLILRDDGTVAAFGSDLYGQDGHVPGDDTTTATPTTVAGIDHVTAIAAGQFHALALKSDGTVWSWGRAPYLGSAAATTDTGTPAPVALPPGSVAVAIAAGGGHSLALLQDGSVWGWGANNAGQVGDGSTTTVADPVQVIPPPAGGAPRVTAISTGSSSSVALYDDGTFVAWGQNAYGQLGLGNGGAEVHVPTAPDPSVVAAQPDHYPALASISAVGQTTYAITRSGGLVYGWGSGGGLGFGDGPATYDFAFPYTGAAGTDPGQTATEIPQRVGRLKGAAWLGVGGSGSGQIAAVTPTLTPVFSGPLAFFSQPVGTVSARAVTPILSDGDPTTVTSIKVTGPNATDFEIVRYNKTDDPADVGQLPLALAANQYLNVYLRFYPSALGDRNATLQVSGDGETTSIPLSGFGTALPGNTPGANGKDGSDGRNGADGASITGPVGPAGPAGKDGVVTFTAKKATTVAKRGHAATLSFTIKNATKGRLVATTATATAPKAIAVKGGRAIAIRALAAGASRTVKMKVTVGRRVTPGTYAVRLRLPYGTRAVTATAKVKVVR